MADNRLQIKEENLNSSESFFHHVVCMLIYFQMKAELFGGIKIEIVKTRLCDAKNIDWLYEFLKVYAHIDGTCPYKPVRLCAYCVLYFL